MFGTREKWSRNLHTFTWHLSVSRGHKRICNGHTIYIWKFFMLLLLFSTKRYYSTEFFRFFAELWMHAPLLIIVWLCSNLCCWIEHYLSFLEKNWTNLSSLLAFLQLFKYYVWFFGQKTSKKMCALLKKRNLFLTYLLNGKLYLKNSKGFKLQSFDSISCKKMA